MSQSQRKNYALLQYYLREKLWRHANTLASDIAQGYSDFVFRLWKAFTLDMEGSVAEALQEYKLCEANRDVQYAALTGTQLIYRRNNDREGINDVQGRIDRQADRRSVSSQVHAALVLWHGGDPNHAREVINKVLDADPDYRDEYTSAQLVRGWIDLTSGRGAYLDKCNVLFDRVIQAESSQGVDVDATMGKIAFLERKQQVWPAQELTNKLVVAHPNFVPALIVKAKGLIRAEDWEQATEVTQRVLAKDNTNVEATILTILYLLVNDTRVSAAAANMNDLLRVLGQKEPRNPQLYYSCAQCFSRLSGGNLQILNLTGSMVETAVHLAPNNSDYQAEVAYQQLLKGDPRTAYTMYKKATSSNDGNITPLLGLIRCTIVSGKYDEAQQQIDFLNEIQSPQSKNAELLFLHAMLLWRKDKNQAASLEKLDQASEIHRQDVGHTSTGLELYIRLNPPLVLDMAREYIQHCRTEPPTGQEKADRNVERTRRVLDLLLRHFPGSTEAQLLSSKMAFVSGDTAKASSMIASCIRKDHSLSEAHLLAAQIFLFTNQITQANQSLEQALSLDFEVRDQPQYALLRGTVLCRMGEFKEALEVLQHGAKVIQSPSATRSKSQKLLSVQDHVALYLQLAQVYIRLKDPVNARRTIENATKEFRDSAQMGRIIIAAAMIMARTDVDGAIEALRTVPPTSEFFLSAKAQMANIYLSLKQNRRLFARCYEELVEASPTVQSFIQLGEAYCSIQESEKAIVAFEKARAMDANNTELAVKIGRTLVTMHDYQQALKYYKNAVAADPGKASLRLDLATLYWRLGDASRAIQTLNESPVHNQNSAQDDQNTAMERVNITLLMARIYKSSNDGKSVCESLIKAKVFQAAVLSKLRGENTEVMLHERAIAASICYELGEYFNAQHQTDKALQHYNESLKHDETNDKAMLALAHLYLKRGDLEDCEVQCNALLRINPLCEEAIMMLADLMYHKNRFEDAAFHFLQILDKKPCNYVAMVQYVQLLRRAGHLTEAPAVFTNAEKQHRPGQKPDSGLCYARGLYHRFTNNSREALKDFMLARTPRDGPWAQKALISMIEIYIVPDNENVWEDEGDHTEMTQSNLRAAEKLLKEVKNNEKRQLLQAYCLVASKKKESMDQALSMFFEIMSAAEGDKGNAAAGPPLASPTAEASLVVEGSTAPSTTDRVHVPALVGMATVLQLQRQTPKARNYLKRLTKANYNPEEDDDYERGWLLLADIYIQSGKYDLAQDLLKRTIQANKSSCRAWEFMGLIYEKEQAYKDASDCYESAWKLVNESDPSIGFKLAFNYLKAHRYVQAIDVCQKVLKTHPDYPKIRREVLERARSLLRPQNQPSLAQQNNVEGLAGFLQKRQENFAGQSQQN